MAGITVAAYLVPQVMAYAGVAGLPPVVGLWAVLPAMVLYALIGSSRLLSVGPESTTALMTAVAVGPLAGGDPGRYAVLAAGLAVVVGLVAPRYWRLVPRPLLALVATTAVVAAFGLDDRYGIAVIGSVPSGLPVPALPSPATFRSW